MKTKFFFPVIAMIAFSTVANAAKARFDEIIRVDNAEVVAFERRADVDTRVTAFERRADVDAKVTAFERRADVDARVAVRERRADKDIRMAVLDCKARVDVRNQNNVVI